jgi:large-conductance mechanosensitive channel
MIDLVTIFSSFNIIGSAIGISIGSASNEVIKSLTDGILMPLISTFFKKGLLENYVVNVRGSKIKIGAFLSNIIYFLLVLLVIIIVLKYVLGNMIKNIVDAKSSALRENIKHTKNIELHLDKIRKFNVPL